MTNAQLQALKAAIIADSELNAYPNTDDGAYDIGIRLQEIASPAFIVWRTSVPQSEIILNGFDWTRVDNLSIGKSRIWEWMFKFGSIDPSKINVRAGIDATWTGTQADLDVRAAVYVHCKRSATRGEKILATGTGTTNSPATMGHEGPINYLDIKAARNLP